ncbi:MAG TPA: hypothetical protein VNW92_12640 [Polyangiaceae bacterium]|jgi:hypothetical protein|nr:hypothetical protein [Polyangiaceae bacterium]
MAVRFVIRAPLVLVVAAATSVLSSARSARADDAPGTDSVAKASALFADARKLVQDGNYAQACPKFEESLRLHFGIGAQFNLADCWEHIGRSASARTQFLGAAASAHAAAQAEREQVAKARADALEARLIRLLIDVRATDKELSVRRNHITVGREEWGTATPIDPGIYLIEASAPGKKHWSANVTVPSTASEAVSVVVPPLEELGEKCEPKPESPTEGALANPHVEPTTTPPPPLVEPAPRSARRIAYTLSLAGLGVASVGLGTVLAIEYKSKNDDAKVICPSGMGCTASEIDSHSALVSDAKSFRTWSFVGFGVGGAALVGAAVLYFAPSSSSQRASNFVASPFMTADGSWGAVATGRF